MYGGRRRRIEATAQTFREKGAVSPEKAMTAQDLGLPPNFEQAMKRRLGLTGIFVEVSGKYYLNEDRLKQFEQQAWGGGRHGSGGWVAFRIARMLVTLTIVILLLVDFVSGRGTVPYLVIVGLVILWIAITIAQIFLIGSRHRDW